MPQFFGNITFFIFVFVSDVADFQPESDEHLFSLGQQESSNLGEI